ncbi:MAG: hypothetical protein DYG83_18215 [Candidatus Brocadia sp. AMX2]|uniref:ParE-like toxin domain-containing protein n=1 Tax=Candidatus Brocadia sinica JPN1 TaxID=1197129 RepID=A0ABQ0JXJ5_9BACT|nr:MULTISPECIES: hypothetical protein [Brocadia]MBC6934158.1 hypothetical protein [Candidatus Brocadia sp.]MBL1169757.1 hypothetical protein [Candidatus Brocadia sp. AMX1]MCK6467891.1 hypothetical protein [Candidatus Brocadia sinica]NOG40725.1 hypothetical protein [Planctomycetota bacterium]KAA0241124.1 MAG: hypothetical protein EDM70_18695 [Candidatus Brocadia sp. AMX2]
MKSYTTKRFRKALEQLPDDVRKQARKAYELFVQNPYHPSLRFKQIHSTKHIYTVRINIDYRAVGARNGDEIVWFWIGPHAEYDKLISQIAG